MRMATNLISYLRRRRNRLIVHFEDINNSNRGPIYIGDRQRLATITSVKFLDNTTFACCHFVGRKIYLVRFDYHRKNYRLLDSTDTVFNGNTVETDLCDSNERGEVATSNFYQRTFTQYRREGDRILFDRDLPFNPGNNVHGVKYFRPNILAVTCVKTPAGIYFFNSDTMEQLLYIETSVKAQDVCFLSDNRWVLLATRGTPTSTKRKMYKSEIHLIDFDIPSQKYETTFTKTYETAHVDCMVSHNGKLYITDQFNNTVLIVNPNSLEQTGELTGYTFPHGIDIKYGMIAVTNYGNNTVDIRPI